MTEQNIYIACGFVAGLVLLTIMIIKFVKHLHGPFYLVDHMDGEEFEKYLQRLLVKIGYETETTVASHDYGADLILYKNGIKTVVQAKRYSGHVSIQAVQEVFTAMYFYDADASVVITNNDYTKSAICLAEKVGVKLVNREDLEQLMNGIDVIE